MTANRLAAAIAAVVERSQDPQFYLRLSQLTFISGYGIVGHLLESSPTLHDAIQSLMRYERLGVSARHRPHAGRVPAGAA